MRNLTELEASRIIGELARKRAAAGEPRLTERQASQILRAHRQVIELPDASPLSSTIRLPEPRRSAVRATEDA